MMISSILIVYVIRDTVDAHVTRLLAWFFFFAT